MASEAAIKGAIDGLVSRISMWTIGVTTISLSASDSMAIRRCGTLGTPIPSKQPGMSRPTSSLKE